MLISPLVVHTSPGTKARIEVMGKLPAGVWYDAYLDRGGRRLLCFGDRWEVFSLDLKRVVQTISLAEIPICAMKLLRGGKEWIWLSNLNNVCETDRSNLRTVRVCGIAGNPDSFDYNAATDTVYVGGSGRLVALRPGGQRPRALANSEDPWKFLGVGVAPSGRALATVEYSVALRTFGKNPRQVKLHGPGDGYLTLDPTFSPDGGSIAAGTTSGWLEVWSTKTHRLRMAANLRRSVWAIHWFGDTVQAVASPNWRFKQNGPDVVASFKPPNSHPLFEAELPDMDSKFVDWLDSTTLVTMSEDGTISIVRIDGLSATQPGSKREPPTAASERRNRSGSS